jgi:hypothetical protein
LDVAVDRIVRELGSDAHRFAQTQWRRRTMTSIKLMAGMCILALATASLVHAQGNKPNEPGASQYAPGHKAKKPGGAKKYAPGQRAGEPGEAKKYAPGQRMQKN